MANFGQATFVGSEVVIECGDKMSCCDRQQAQAKVKGYNDEIAGNTTPPQPGPLQISPPEPKPRKIDLASTKSTAQAEAWRDFRQDMNSAKTPADRKAVADKHCMSECLAEQVASKWKPGQDSSADLGVQMDHTIEVKWGGAAGPDGLKALGSQVNNFFGSIAKRTGDDMLKATPKEEEISAVHFVCNPPCKPPRAKDNGNNYSTGPGTPVPAQPPGAPNTVRTYLAD
jgi:hypothetical protein